MSNKVRCTVHRNGKEPTNGKLIQVDKNASFNSFLSQCSTKLDIDAQRVFTANGGEIDDVGLIRDDDNLFISEGEDFTARRNANGPSSGVATDNQPTRKYRVAVMGSGGVGKSAVTLRYVQNVFVEEYDPTIEDAYRKIAIVDGEPAALDILDTAGQEDYTALRTTWMRDRQGFILVYSLLDERTFQELRTFYEQLQNVHETNFPPLVILANKADMADRRKVSEESGRAMAAELGNAIYLETSAKTGLNVEEAFVALVKEIRRRTEPAKKKTRFRCMLL